MLYSVWNQGIGAYDYFEDSSKQESLNTPAPKHIPSRKLGVTVEQAAWPLPSQTRKIGSGPTAIGRVASRSAGGVALGGVTDEPLVKAGLLAAAALLAWKYLVKGGR